MYTEKIVATANRKWLNHTSILLDITMSALVRLKLTVSMLNMRICPLNSACLKRRMNSLFAHNNHNRFMLSPVLYIITGVRDNTKALVLWVLVLEVTFWQRWLIMVIKVLRWNWVTLLTLASLNQDGHAGLAREWSNSLLLNHLASRQICKFQFQQTVCHTWRPKTSALVNTTPWTTQVTSVQFWIRIRDHMTLNKLILTPPSWRLLQMDLPYHHKAMWS